MECSANPYLVIEKKAIVVALLVMIWCLVRLHYLFLFGYFLVFRFCCSKFDPSEFELVVSNVTRGG